MQRIKDSLRKTSSRDSLDSTSSTTSLEPKDQQVPSSPAKSQYQSHQHHHHLLRAPSSPTPSCSGSFSSANSSHSRPKPGSLGPGLGLGSSLGSRLGHVSSSSTLSLLSDRRDEVTFETVRIVPRSARSEEITTTPESDESLTPSYNFPSTSFSSSSPSCLHQTATAPTQPSPPPPPTTTIIATTASNKEVGGSQGTYGSSPVHLSPNMQPCGSPSLQANQFLSTNSPNRSGRSRSFDSAAASAAASGSNDGSTNRSGKTYIKTTSTFLELPKWKMLVRNKNSSSSSTSVAPYERDCVHCMLMHEISKVSTLTVPSVSTPYIGSSSYGSMLSDNISTSCSPPPSSSPSVSSEGSVVEDSDSESMGLRTASLGQSESLEDEVLSEILDPANLPTVTLSLAPEIQIIETEEDSGLTVISLEVPVLPKSGRSASVDSSYLQVPQRTDIGIGESPPVKAQRSRSVDVALPVGPDGPYIVVPTEKPQPIITQLRDKFRRKHTSTVKSVSSPGKMSPSSSSSDPSSHYLNKVLTLDSTSETRQVRSASYDEIRLRRDLESSGLRDDIGSITLDAEADPSSLATEPEILSSGSSMLD
ncbi:uncharacterized protein LOC128390275, partial [Panonychus citri]|uniref:uncharacterized protein LOC128390275 n=1 Tax=Panonychus citri TaxID=50023 RepID=UPI002307E98D